MIDGREAHAVRERGSSHRGSGMAEGWYIVPLDLEAIRRNLAKADRATYSTEYVEQWLRDAGFHRAEKGWLVRSNELGQVQPSEVVSIEEWRGPLPS